MTHRRKFTFADAALLALFSVAVLAAWQLSRPPALAESLRNLPQVAKVEYSGPGGV